MNPSQAFQKPSSGQANLQAHIALNQFTQQENAEKNLAAQQEAAYYERLNQEAEEMLAPDRQRFDGMVTKMQGSIREKIAMYGGDRREFLKNGGQKVIQNFSSDITKSDEFQTYTRNKENYVKLKDAMEKGLGHRISIRDKKSLENYEANGSGQISYSGMMSEIEMPDDNNYNLGADIPLTDILYNEDNYMKILGNYMINFPDDKQPTTESLLGFMNIMGYGKKGSNRDLLNLQRKQVLEKAKATKDPKVSEDKRPQLFTTNLLKLQDYIPKETKIGDLFDLESGKYSPKNKLKSFINSDTFVASNLKDGWKHDSWVANEDEAEIFDKITDKGVTGWFNKVFSNRWKPAEAVQISGEHDQTIAEHFLQIAPNENGSYRLDPSQIDNMYSSKGVEYVGNNNLAPGTYEGEYENLGVITGMFGKNKQGNNQMIMQITNDEGEIVEGAQKDHINGMDDSGVKMGYFIALRNKENERIYYKKIDMEDTATLRSLSTKIGSADDLKNQNDSSQRLDGDFKQAEASVAKEQDAYDQDLLTIDKRIENNANFIQEAELYSNTEDKSQNRSTLIKSFYAVTGIDPGTQGFNDIMKLAPETAKLMRTFGHKTSDEELIDIFVSEMNQDVEDAEKSSNEELGKELKNAYKRYLILNKK